MKINEVFESFQGEGKSLGLPSIFLRTAGCNLACIWCDTPYTWNWEGSPFKHPDKYDKKVEIKDVAVSDLVIQLNSYETRNLVVTGGEPMLQQRELTQLIKELKTSDRAWRIEIETNGTILPTDEFLDCIDQINCSPKLSNSGSDNHKYKRIVLDALRKLASNNKTNFKFVVAGFEDMSEVLEIIRLAEIVKPEAYLMPEGKTRKEQESRQEEIRYLCREYGLNFSPRIHILMYDNKRAV